MERDDGRNTTVGNCNEIIRQSVPLGIVNRDQVSFFTDFLKPYPRT